MSSVHAVKLETSLALVAGSLAALAYVGAMKIDMALTHYPTSDLQVLEGFIRKRPSRIPWVGFLAHLVNGAGLGVAYAIIQRRLPGPAWVRGAFFSEGFILLAWPTTPLLDRFHPLIRRGALPPFARRVAFLQNLSRHLVFGIVLGESLRLLSRKPSTQR